MQLFLVRLYLILEMVLSAGKRRNFDRLRWNTLRSSLDRTEGTHILVAVVLLYPRGSAVAERPSKLNGNDEYVARYHVRHYSLSTRIRL